MKKLFFLAVLLFCLVSLPARAVCPIITEGGVQKTNCDMEFLGDVTFDGTVSIAGGITDLLAIHKTKADVTYYLRTTGSSQNDCLTIPTACKTLNSAQYYIPKVIANNIIIDMGEGTFAASDFSDYDITSTGSLEVFGVLGAPTLTTGTTSGTSTAGTNTSLTDSTQTWTVDELRGMLFLIGSSYGTVRSNTGTVVQFAHTYSAASGGSKVYTIVEQKTKITGKSSADLGPLSIRNVRSREGGYTFRDLFVSGEFVAPSTYPSNCLYVSNSDGGNFTRLKVGNGSPLGMYLLNNTGVSNIENLYAYDTTNGWGVYLSNVANVSTFTGMIFNCGTGGTWDGIKIEGCNQISNLDLSSDENAGNGLFILDSVALKDSKINANDNTNSGLYAQGVIHIDLSAFNAEGNTKNGAVFQAVQHAEWYGGTIVSNGINGLQILDGTYFFSWNTSGTPTISSNSADGILMRSSTANLRHIVGTANVGFGLEMDMASSAKWGTCTVTGTTADITLGAATEFDWTTDFPSSGDAVTLSTKLNYLERL